MRAYNKTGSLSVHAIAGAYVVLLGIDMEEAASEGVLGFGIERIEHGHGNSRAWLRALKVFPDVPVEEGMVSTEHHPIQGFFWGDFTTRYGHEYTYRIVAMRGKPGALRASETVEIRIATEKEDEGQHAVYFNRGVAGSQAYVRKFGDRRPADVPNRAAFQWLSRGLFRAMLDFIHKANGPDWGLRVAAYELQQGAVLKALREAADSEADVKIIFDARVKASGPADANWAAIRQAEIEDLVTPRTRSRSAISHNKFMVLLHNGEPVEVWTGSTNFTDGGIFGHSNCGHIVRNKDVAVAYLKYWQELQKDPEMRDIRPWNDEIFPISDRLPAVGVGTAFSPRSNLDLLRWYARLMDKANTAVFFTAAFGVNDLFEEVLEHPKPYLRYVLLESADEEIASLLNEVAVANILPQNEFERWMAEHLSGLNTHVKYIHTKYMIIDPLGKEPVLITGSANFSDASTRKNDENMLVIRGDKRIADLYLSEFMRLFNHFQFRGLAHARAATGPETARSLLVPNDPWKGPYYQQSPTKYCERPSFASLH